MKYEFHPEAFREYAYAVSRYEEHQRGLGGRFIQSVEIAIDSICKAPNRWPVLEDDVRRHLTRVFPYAVLSGTRFSRTSISTSS